MRDAPSTLPSRRKRSWPAASSSARLSSLIATWPSKAPVAAAAQPHRAHAAGTQRSIQRVGADRLTAGRETAGRAGPAPLRGSASPRPGRARRGDRGATSRGRATSRALTPPDAARPPGSRSSAWSSSALNSRQRAGSTWSMRKRQSTAAHAFYNSEPWQSLWARTSARLVQASEAGERRGARTNSSRCSIESSIDWRSTISPGAAGRSR